MSNLTDMFAYTKNPTNVVQYSTRLNARNQVASVIKLADNSYLCTWTRFGAETLDLAPSQIWAKKSNDLITWGNPYLVVDSPVGTSGPRCASLYQKASGDIILICMMGTDAGVSTMIHRYTSSDNGLTFAGETVIHSSTDYEAQDYYTIGSHRIFVTQTGRLLYPFDVCTTAAHFSSTAETLGRVLYSDDEGGTWSLSATLIDPGSGTNGLLAESVICQLPAGSLLRASRTRSGFVMISTSSDDGATWSTPSTKSATLAASNASIWMSYTNGKLIAIVDRPEGGVIDGTARIHMDLWQSVNSGVTWTFVKNLLYKNGVYMFTEPIIYDSGTHIYLFYTYYPANTATGYYQSVRFEKLSYAELT